MLWIVGKIFPDFREYLESRNISYGVLWDNSLPVPATYHMPLLQLDFSEPAELFEQISRRPDISISALIVAGYENYVLPAAHLANRLDLPAPSVEAALAATDKSVMRTQFAAYNPALTPDFIEAGSWDAVEAFMQSHTYPVMLKPASLMKSLLITKNNNLDELRRNYEYLQTQIQAIYSKFHVTQPPKIILEEFLQGSMHTVAGFVGSDGEPALISDIVDCVTAQEIGLDDNFLYSRQLPTVLSPEQQRTMLEAARQGVLALGLTSTPVHIELILTSDGPKIIEIGARIGGYRTRMYQAARGIDLYQSALDVAYDKPVDLHPQAEASCAALELFPDGQGQFAAIHGREGLSSLPSLQHFSVKPEAGTIIGRASQGYKAAAVIMLAHSNPEQIDKDLEYIRKHVTVAISPSNS